MNRIYRLCWNAATSQWVAASELARSRRPGARVTASASAPRAASIALGVALALGSAGAARAGQTGGQVVSGSGAINQHGTTTTINQASQHLSLNWQTFDIGANETVNFVQPGRDAIAVNRILGNSASEIYGHLNANGQVWLINPKGVLFGEGSQVNVGGLVASTLDTADSSLDATSRTFSGNGKGSIVNKGSIRAANGGYVALLGNTVSNQGTISAQLGTVAMGGGSAITLTFEGSQLLHLQVDRSTLDNLVENRQLVQADGGRIFMTAGAADSLLASTVNNTGVVRAQTVQNHNGEIVLLGGMTAGHVNVEGTLDASAPDGGNGGAIETSGAFAHIGSAAITAGAPYGKAGTWLVDPYDLTIDATAANAISSSLNNGTNVTESTSAGSASGAGVQNPNGVGDINVNAAINWTNPNSTLTLTAYRAINVNAPISGAGRVALTAQGAAGNNGNINLAAGGTVSGGAGVTLTAANAFINNAGGNALSSASGKWLVYSANRAADVTGGLTPQFIQYNAAAGATPLGTGSGFLYKQTAVAAITGLSGTVEKTYDGTATASLDGTNVNATLANGDRIATATGTYGSKDAASGIQVTAAGSSAGYTFTDASGLVPVYGYTITGGGASANIGVIDPRQLGVSVINNPTKTYNGTTTATLSSANYLTSGLVAGENITFSQPNSVAYDSADAGVRTVNVGFLPSNFTAANGTKLSNYVLPTTATGPGTINKAKVQLSGLIGSDKVYDGTTTDGLDKSRVSIFGVIAGDAANATLDSTNGIGQFADANVGNGKSVSATGFQLVGSKATNYDLVLQSDITGSITPKALSISGVSALSKVYDATRVASLAYTNLALNGLVNGTDSANISLVTAGANGTFATKNVGNGIGVTASGFTLAGTGTGNYTLSQPTGLFANITPAPLLISITGNPTRTYNGTTTANIGAGDVTITGFQGGETGSVVQSAGATYASKDAGTRLLTALLEPSDFSLGNGAQLSNYTFPTSITGNGTIAQAILTWSLVGNPTKIYDGNTNAALTSDNFQLSGFLSGEGATVTQTHGTYDTANVGQRNVTANLGIADFTALNATVLSNYVLPTVMTGVGTITPAPLAGFITAGINGPTRVYDGTTVAALTPANFILSGFASGEGASVNQTVGIFASKNVGKQAVSAALTSANFDANAGTNLGNYTLPSMAYGTGEIQQALLTASIVGNPSKVYDGTRYVTLTPQNYQVLGFVAGEGADIVPSSSISFDTKNVGSNKTITANMAVSSYLPNSQTLLSNYILPTVATGPGTITAAPLYIVGVSAQSRDYNATTLATLNSGGASLVGLVGADSNDTGKVALTAGTTGLFADANAGVGKAVTANGFSISGSEAGNYTLMPLAGLTATISPFTLSINGVSAIDKIYDGNTGIALNTGTASLGGIFSADNGNVTLDASGAAGNVRSANAANNLDVTTSGFGLAGSAAGNYRVNQVSGLTANISKRAVTASITGDPTKPYDGSNSVTLTAGDYTLSGFVSGQGASIPQSSTAKYNNVNAGSNRGLTSTLSVSDFVALAGTNLANYDLPVGATGALGTITPFVINLMGQRIYDATTSADAGLFTNGGTIAGVNGERVALTGSGVLSTKNVGNQRSFANFGTLALGDNTGTAANYTLAGGIDWVTITPATLTVAGTVAADKAYDRSTAAQLSGSTLVGRLGSDDVTLANFATGTFVNKNAGVNKAVSTSMTVDGGDSSNYILVQPAGLTATITPLTITPTATADSRQYDGTTNATATVSSSGVLAGDTVTFGKSTMPQFDGKDVANGRTVTVSNITKGGADAGNYVLSTTSATALANITPRVLNLSGTRVYDTSTSIFSAGLTLGNLVSGESLGLSGTGNTSSKNVGSYNGGNFALGSLTLANGAGGLAGNYTLSGGTDTYTITPATLHVINTTADSKVYDANTIAALHHATLDGVLGSDTVDLTHADAGTFSDKNVGTHKAVSTAMGIAGTDAGNYTLVQPADVVADITAKLIHVDANGVSKVYDGTTASGATLSSQDLAGTDQVTFNATSNLFDTKDVGTGKVVSVNGITASGTDAGNYTLANTNATTMANITPFIINLSGARVYDGTATAGASLFGANGVVTGVHGETLVLSGSGKSASKNVATYQRASDGTGNFDLDTLVLNGTGGSSAGNYALQGGTDSFTITPLAVTVNATGGNKVYDATTAATATLAASGVISGDAVNFALGGAIFGDKNVANGKAISVTGITATGADAGNYTFNTSAQTTGSITPLAISGSIVADDRVYDRTTGAATHGSLSGVLGGDVVDYTSTTGSFQDKHVGNGKTVNVSGVVGGTDAGNYVVTSNATTIANITPATIVVSTSAGDKMYDGDASATTALSQTGLLSGDDVTFSGASSLFSDANAANGKTVTVSGITAAGADAGNYVYNTVAATLANITPYIINLHGEREYDGSTVGTAGVFGNQGVIAGINGDTLDLSGAGSVGDKQVGVDKTLVSTGTLVLTGNGTALSSNYTLVGGAHDLTITPKQIVVDATGSNKVYDGGSLAFAGLGSAGVVSGDQITFTGGAANYSDKNVANGKTITVSGITAAGADAGNYAFNTTALTTGNITPLAIGGSIVAVNKTYDGTTAAQTSGTVDGVLAGDNLGIETSGSFVDKNVGSGKAVGVAGVLTGADAGNYTLTTNSTTLADVYKVILNLDGTRVYDGGTVGSAGMFGSAGVIAGVAGESLILSGQGVLGSKNVAADRPLAGLGSLALNDDGAGLASNYTLVGGNHVATVTPLGINAGISADDKVYDGNTGASTHGVLDGVLGGDQVNLATTGSFVDRNAANGKTVVVGGTLSGGDSANYTLTFNPTTTASITKRPVVVGAQGTDKFFDGNTVDKVTLSSSGLIDGDVVSFGATSALFADPSVGHGKPVTVDGIFATGADAGNYAFNVTAETSANIDQNTSQGASASALTQIDAVLQPDALATPYGVASNVTVGDYTGNHKKTRQPVEKNVGRSDFNSGLSLQVIGGGVRLPADVMQ
ncbi:YDG domain-containing protein [Luteibacter sp. 9135]|uniref:YDG domain-containing protein n=1 Tax=Luteibacter sp. 9135 TaxID=1500893 RepID=UPI000AA45491|nr:YDG domain-containing protein [Luteibacter sp. 9135]